MVKVCHVTSVHKRYDDRIFHKECKSLSEYGYNVTLLVNDTEEDEILEGVNIISLRKKYSSRVKRIIKGLKEILEKALEINAEVYHLHDPELLLIAKKLKKNGKKVIFDSHEYYYEQIKTKPYLPKILRNLFSELYLIYENRIFSSIDGVVYVGNILNDNNQIVDKFIGRCKNVQKIENYPLKIMGDLESEELLSIKKNGIFKVCYAGGLSESRGIEQLIDACYYSGVKLILAGEFSNDEFANKIKSKESYSCVDYRGYCSSEEVYKIYEESDLGAQLLLNVGQYYKLAVFGVKVYEYMQMKLPILMFDSLFNIKMVEKYKFGKVVNPYDVLEISSVISDLANNREACKEMGIKAFELYKSQFTWEKQMIKLDEFYNKIIFGNK